MRIPETIERAIETMCSKVPLSVLTKHFQEYSQSYREGKNSKRSIPHEIEKICYLATRFPATFAASCFVADEMQRRNGYAKTLLDLGAGPGTALIALLQQGYPIESATLFEESRGFIEMGKAWTPAFAKWQSGDILKQESFPEAELVVLSYSLGEIAEEKRKSLLEKAWRACQKNLIIIEPGTPKAFKNILTARDLLIGLRRPCYSAMPS